MATETENKNGAVLPIVEESEYKYTSENMEVFAEIVRILKLHPQEEDNQFYWRVSISDCNTQIIVVLSFTDGLTVVEVLEPVYDELTTDIISRDTLCMLLGYAYIKECEIIY